MLAIDPGHPKSHCIHVIREFCEREVLSIGEASCYGLNVCEPPIDMLNPNAQCDSEPVRSLGSNEITSQRTSADLKGFSRPSHLVTTQ